MDARPVQETLFAGPEALPPAMAGTEWSVMGDSERVREAAAPVQASQSERLPFPSVAEHHLAQPVRDLSTDDLVRALLPPTTTDRQTNDEIMQMITQSPAQLAQRYGMSETDVRPLTVAMELHQRLLVMERPKRASLRMPEDVAAHMQHLNTLGHEEAYCLPLDARSQLIGDPVQISRGDVDGTELSPRLFFAPALTSGAVSAIAVHNHPTGDPGPSSADRQVTKRLAEVGRVMGIELVDHVIVGGPDRFTSLRRSEPGLWARD